MSDSNAQLKTVLTALVGCSIVGVSLYYLYRSSLPTTTNDNDPQSIPKPPSTPTISNNHHSSTPAKSPPKPSVLVPETSSRSSSAPPPPPHPSPATPIPDPWLTVTTNETLVHELLLQGGDFLESWGLSLDEESSSSSANPFVSVAKQVRTVAEQAMWDALGEGLSQEPPQVERLLAVIVDAKDILIGMVPEGTSSREGKALRAKLEEALDPDYLSMRLLQSPFDFEYLIQIFTLLVEAVTALESDARSSVTTEKFARLMAGGGDSAHPSPRASSGGGVEESENVQIAASIAIREKMRAEAKMVVRCARFIFDRISQLQEDISKARLQMLSHVVAGRGGAGADFERRRLERLVLATAQALHPASEDPLALTPLTDIMPRTHRWLKDACSALIASGAAPREERAFVRAAVALGVAHIIASPHALRPETCPETLGLDARRFVGLQDALQKLSLTACAIVIGGQVLASKQLSLTAALIATIRERFLAILSDPFIALPALKAEMCEVLRSHVIAQGKPWEGRGQSSAIPTLSPSPRTPKSDDTLADRFPPSEPAAAAAAAGPPPKDDLIVENMIEKIFGDSPVFRRQNAALGKCLEHLLASFVGVTLPLAAASPSSPSRTASGAPVDPEAIPYQILRTVGADTLLGDVRAVAEHAQRVAAATLSVAEPFYVGLTRQIRSEGAMQMS